MKELSIEEKASRYDEAIKRGKQIQNTPYTAHWDIMKEVVEHLLPELGESKDERIRKELILYLGDMPEDTELRNGVTNRDVLVWLEKKGGQHPKFRVGDTIKCKFDDRQFTIKSVDLDKGIYDYTQEGCGNDIDYADEEFELVEQKSWSEEDEKVLDSILNDIKQGAIPDNDDINWLKTFKERVQLQPKSNQKCGGEDKKMVKCC